MNIDERRFVIDLSGDHIIRQIRDLSIAEGVKVAGHILENELTVGLTVTDGKPYIFLIGGNDEFHKKIDLQELIASELDDFEENDGVNELATALETLDLRIPPKGT